LIGHVEGMGNPDAVALLQQNLEQEQHTLDEVTRATRELALSTH
jgi:ferritin-like metal-binding protein YciE